MGASRGTSASAKRGLRAMALTSSHAFARALNAASDPPPEETRSKIEITRLGWRNTALYIPGKAESKYSFPEIRADGQNMFLPRHVRRCGSVRVIVYKDRHAIELVTTTRRWITGCWCEDGHHVWRALSAKTRLASAVRGLAVSPHPRRSHPHIHTSTSPPPPQRLYR